MGSAESRDPRIGPRIKAKVESESRFQKCPICLQCMTADNVFWIPCAHSYHEKCIRQWENRCKENQKPNTCPLCDHIYVYDDEF